MSDSNMKRFVTMDAKQNNVPRPRYAPKQHKIERHVPNRPVVGSETRNQRNVKNFHAMDEQDNSCKIVLDKSGKTQYDIPKNPYIQEKTLEHPVFKGHSVDLPTRFPISRDVATPGPNMHVKMGEVRRSDAQRDTGKEISEPAYEGALYTYGMQQTLPRPAAPVEKFNQTNTLQVADQNNRVADPGSILWRNMHQYEASNEMYETRTQFKFQNIRLEQRKERMEKYQARKKEQEAKLEALTKMYLQQKDQDIKNQLSKSGLTCV